MLGGPLFTSVCPRCVSSGLIPFAYVSYHALVLSGGFNFSVTSSHRLHYLPTKSRAVKQISKLVKWYSWKCGCHGTIQWNRNPSQGLGVLWRGWETWDSLHVDLWSLGVNSAGVLGIIAIVCLAANVCPCHPSYFQKDILYSFPKGSRFCPGRTWEWQKLSFPWLLLRRSWATSLGWCGNNSF